MTHSDPQLCRRALREIGEIAAVAVLDDGQMTGQEAIQSIAAIARWVREEAPGGGASCAATVRALADLTRATDFDLMSDRHAMQVFGAVLATLQASDAAPAA